MNINFYKKAAEDIVVNPELIHDTANKMRMIQNNKKPKIKYAIVSCLAAVIIGVLLLPGIEPMTPNIPSNQKGGLATPNNGTNQGKATVPDQDIVMPQITKNFVPFNASEYISVKAPSPKTPFYFDELRRQSDIIILCTISDIGVYRNKAEQYNPRASFGTYIYTVKIDKILSGDIDESAGSLIPIAEMAWANPKNEGDGSDITEWIFTPYSGRAQEAKMLEKEKQYVMFISKKDNMGISYLPWDGFGVFPVDYIEKEARKYSLNELQKEYKYVEEVSRAPMENNLLYRLCSLYVEEEFLSQHREYPRL